MKFPWWDKTSISLFDQILFLTPVMDRFSLELPENLAIEFCSGNGAWVVDRALQDPGHFWVAVEKKLERAKKIWKRAKRLGAANLLVVCGSAENFVSYVLPDEAVNSAFVHFPDPWPKRRHAKHRLMREEFVTALQKRMKKKGTLTFVTDDLSAIQEICLPNQRDEAVLLRSLSCEREQF